MLKTIMLRDPDNKAALAGRLPFMGAGKYYLHDKLSEQQAEAARDGARVSTRGQSDERVWFTHTRNCPSISIPSVRSRRCGTPPNIKRG